MKSLLLGLQKNYAMNLFAVCALNAARAIMKIFWKMVNIYSIYLYFKEKSTERAFSWKEGRKMRRGEKKFLNEFD